MKNFGIAVITWVLMIINIEDALQDSRDSSIKYIHPDIYH